MTGSPLQVADQVESYLEKYDHCDDRPLSKMLPLLFSLRGKPYSLEWSHFLFEPMFRLKNMPRRMIFRTGRQTSKSTNMAASQILRASAQPFYNILTVMPLFEQVRKFSQNYVKPFLSTSPAKRFIIGDKSIDTVLQRSIGNESNLYYMYSHGDPNRIRGVPADEVDLDETQDFAIEDIPIIEACMGASPFKIMRMTGTPKTFDNPIQLYWEDSSQGIWHIPCQEIGCKRVNRSAVDGDLLQMLGSKTLVCSKCGKPLNSKLGFFVHDFPERRAKFAGYHVSQPTLPMHYESPNSWQEILEVQKNKPAYVFHNEILGESYDVGAKVITAEQIREACKVEPCHPENMPHGQYIMQLVGVDWGGRGKEKTTDTEDFVSNTAVALMGVLTSGVIEVKWLHKIPYETDHAHEAELVANVARMSHSEYVAIDYGGQGNVQEQMLNAAGWPAERVIPFTYSVTATTKPLVFYNKPAKLIGARSSFTLDKPRSVLLLCELIKSGQVLLPKNDEYLDDHLRDFLNIYEESIDNPRGSPKRLVKRMSRRTDDVVHAINFGVMAIYHMLNRWPKLAEVFVESI